MAVEAFDSSSCNWDMLVYFSARVTHPCCFVCFQSSSMAILTAEHWETYAENYRHVVTYAGGFADFKRVESLIYAASEYEKTIESVATLIVGDGPDEDVQ
eukprot:gene22049-153_t